MEQLDSVARKHEEKVKAGLPVNGDQGVTGKDFGADCGGLVTDSKTCQNAEDAPDDCDQNEASSSVHKRDRSKRVTKKPKRLMCD